MDPRYNYRRRGRSYTNVFKREWKFTKAGQRYTDELSPNCVRFTVLSYNILSQSALEEHGYLYMHCKPMCLVEEYRITNILNELLESEADVICLQEVEEHVFQSFSEVLQKDGLHGVFKKRTGGKSDGCCIFYRESVFQLLEHRDVEFKINDVDQLDRDNIGVIVCLGPRSEHAREVRLHVATTHLLYNPKRGDIKLCQLRLFLAELDKMALKGIEKGMQLYHPIILCGDFNMEPWSPLYNFLELCSVPIRQTMSSEALSGQLSQLSISTPLSRRDVSLEKINVSNTSRFIKEPETKKKVPSTSSSSKKTHAKPTDSESCVQGDRLSNSMNFVSAQYLSSGKDSPRTLTSMVGQRASSVDHIFYNLKRLPDEPDRCRNFKEDGLLLTGFLELLGRRELLEMGGLPNLQLSSDHIYLMSEFLIVPIRSAKWKGKCEE